jgi:tetratricopeptide (TPR) repeat protein
VPAGLALTAALVVSALRLRRRYPLFGFSVAWFLIALLPYSNIYLLFNYKADHNLYVPLVVLSALGAAALLKAGRRLGDPHRQSWPVIAAGLYFCGLTVAQNAYWRDPVVFYRRTLALNPRSWSSCLNLGNEYASRGRPRRAIDLYQRALRLRPGDPLVLRDLGLAFRDTGDLPRAEQALKEALARDPASARAHDDLGLVFRTAGRLDRAAGEFRESVRLDPRFVGGYVNLGAAYFEMGRYPEAEAALRRALALDRTDAGAWYHLGLVAIKAKKYAVARTCFRNAAAGPAGKKKKALFHLAAVDLRLGRAKEAAAVMARAFPSREERQFRDAELKQAVGEMQ